MDYTVMFIHYVNADTNKTDKSITLWIIWVYGLGKTTEYRIACIQMRTQQLVINDNKPIVSTYLTLFGKKIMLCILPAKDCWHSVVRIVPMMSACTGNFFKKIFGISQWDIYLKCFSPFELLAWDRLRPTALMLNWTICVSYLS